MHGQRNAHRKNRALFGIWSYVLCARECLRRHRRRGQRLCDSITRCTPVHSPQCIHNTQTLWFTCMAHSYSKPFNLINFVSGKIFLYANRAKVYVHDVRHRGTRCQRKQDAVRCYFTRMNHECQMSFYGFLFLLLLLPLLHGFCGYTANNDVWKEHTHKKEKQTQNHVIRLVRSNCSGVCVWCVCACCISYYVLQSTLFASHLLVVFSLCYYCKVHLYPQPQKLHRPGSGCFLKVTFHMLHNHFHHRA